MSDGCHADYCPLTVSKTTFSLIYCSCCLANRVQDVTGASTMPASRPESPIVRGQAATALQPTPRQTASPSSPDTPDPLDRRKTAQTRVKGACALVAAESGVPLEEVLDLVEIEPLYDFSTANNIDLTDCVRETYRRTIVIRDALDELAAERGVNRNWLGLFLNWFDVYEFAIQHKKESNLMDVMGEAFDWVMEQKSTTVSNKSKASKLGINKIELKRMAAFKPTADGRANQSERQETRQAQR